MRISAPRRETAGDRTRIAVDVRWEDSPRAPLELFAEFPAGVAEALSAEGDPWIIPAAVAAQRHGERRVRVAQTLCPALADGLRTALELQRRWFGIRDPAPAIEAESGWKTRLPPGPRAAIFFSGGVDSIFSVLKNRDRYGPDHPASIRDAVVVEGYCFPPSALGSPRSAAYWTRTERATAAFCATEGLTRIPVKTNMRDLDDDFGFFGERFHAAMLSGIGHLLGRRISAIGIAAGLDVPFLRPWGSHPLLDPLFSGGSLAVFHDGLEASRLEKVARLVRSPAALESLIVCNEGPLSTEDLNCGSCEKCLRTLASFVAAGIGPDAGSFACRDLAPTRRGTLEIGPHPWAVEIYWREIEPVLRERGRQELADGARAIAERARAIDAWHDGRSWKGRLRRLDGRWLGGRVLALKRRVRAGRA